MTHTPGPWKIEDQQDGLYIRTLDNGWIAKLLLPPDTRNERDNAKLIEAAPDLLEALEWALPRVNTTYLTGTQLANYLDATAAVVKAKA